MNLTLLQEMFTHIKSVNSWAVLVHAKYAREDRVNPDRHPHKAECDLIAEASMSIMKACTDILDDLDEIEDAHDEMGAADRDNFKREHLDDNA